jgi:hypothetical protein
MLHCSTALVNRYHPELRKHHQQDTHRQISHTIMTRLSITGPDLREAIEDACEDDDISKLPNDIGMATSTDTNAMRRWLDSCVRHSAQTDSLNVLRFLIQQGADVTALPGESIVSTDDETMLSREMLEILIEHGWDVNSRGPRLRHTPLLWYVARDTDLVKWFLDHGAEVDPADDTPPDAKKQRKSILECAALEGNIEAFEILRFYGAPVSYNHGLLPSTVMLASSHASRSDGDLDTHFRRSMAMVRQLVDVVGCNVDSISYGVHYGSGSNCSTPLCWIACHTREGTKELIEFLLDRGGDLDLASPTFDDVAVPSARTAAKERPNTYFMAVVTEWEARQQGGVREEAI